jgi:hypothetical protein
MAIKFIDIFHFNYTPKITRIRIFGLKMYYYLATLCVSLPLGLPFCPASERFFLLTNAEQHATIH